MALAYLLCTSMFLVQLISLLPSYFSPTRTHTEVKEVPLKEMDFPFDIHICITPSLNASAIKQFGYEDLISYLFGSSKYNPYLIGWGGFNSKSEAMTTPLEVLNKAKIDVPWNLISGIAIITQTDQTLEGEGALETIGLLGDGHILTMTNITEEDIKGMKWLAINFNRTVLDTNNFTIELRLQGKSLAAQRGIPEHRFHSLGDPIKLDKVSASTFIVKIKKNVFVEEDPSKSCRNYPNPDFASYQECDSTYLKEKVKEIDLDLNPPWLTEDLENVIVEPKHVSPQNLSMAKFHKMFFL